MSKKQKTLELEGTGCEVCRGDYLEDNAIFEKIVCKDCHRTVHKFCYAPDLKDSKHFRCDECKKGKEAICDICSKENGILKEIGEKSWAHVLCALSSPKTKLISYKSLDFKLNKPAIEKSLTTELKECYICKKKGTDVFHCWQQKCGHCAHIDCILSYKFQSGQQSYLTFNLLDKHNYTLLHHLDNEAQSFKFFELYKLKKRFKMIVCPVHNDDPYFIFCTCNKSKLKNGKKQSEISQVCQVCCKICNRWFHQECINLQNLEKDFECKGCKENNFFEKSVQMPELIEKMCQIQTKPKLEREHIRILDSYTFKISQAIIRICTDKRNLFDIDKYFLKKSLQRYVRDDREVRESKERSKQSKMVTNQLKIIEMLYYLIFKEYKKSTEVTAEEMQMILIELSSQKNIIGFEPEVENRYIKFIEDRISAYDKIDVKNLKKTISAFIDQGKQRQLSKMSQDIRQILKAFEKCEYSRSVFNHMEVKESQINFFDLIYKSKLTEEQIIEMFRIYQKILSLDKQVPISYNEYNELTTFARSYNNLTDAKRKIIINSYTNFMKDYKVKQIYQDKYDILKSSLSKMKSGANYKQICELRENIVSKGIFLSINSPFILHQNKVIELELKKRKLLKTISNPSIGQIEPLVDEIKQFLNQVTKIYPLTDNERKQLSKFENRYDFYAKIIHFYNKIRGFDDLLNAKEPEDQNYSDESYGEGLTKAYNKKPIGQLAIDAMLDWDKSEPSINFGFQTLFQAASNSTQFSQSEISIISSFAQMIMDQLNSNYQLTPQKMPPKILEKACKILNFIDCEDSYPCFVQWHENYIKWKKEIQQLYNFEQLLENDEQNESMLKIITNKLQESQTINLDISMEVKKLSILKLWCKLSQKFITECKENRKFTILSIQNLKQNIDKMHYPNNNIRKIIDQLDSQSKSLNKRISKFLERNKIGDVEFYQQLRLMNLKMTIEEAEQLQYDLKKSALEVTVELEQLEEHIQIFRKLPKSLRTFADMIEESNILCQMRKTVLDNSFKYQSLADYEYLVRRIYYLKCIEFNGATCYKEFMKMLDLGGVGSLELYKKSSNLINAYRAIDRAKRQILAFKPKLQALLPTDFKKLRTELKDDQYQIISLEKLYIHVSKAKEKIATYRNAKVEYEKYQQIITELRAIPINTSLIITEITKMKKENEDLCVKATKFVSQTAAYDSLACLEIVNKYKANGIRTDVLDKFQKIVHKYKQIMETYKNINFENYKIFSIYCQQHLQFLKNVEIKRVRQQCFYNIYDQYINSRQPLLEVGQALLHEGGFLCKYFEKVTDILFMMQEVNKKIKSDIYKDEEEEEEQEQEDDLQIMESLDDPESQHSDLVNGNSDLGNIANSNSSKQFEYQYSGLINKIFKNYQSNWREPVLPIWTRLTLPIVSKRVSKSSSFRSFSLSSSNTG